MSILTCQGVVDIFGRKQEMKEKVELDRHIVASADPPLHTIFLPKGSAAARIIANSGCFCINMSDGPERPCVVLIDCFCLHDSLECQVTDSDDVGDSISFTGRVVHAD